MTDVKTEIQNSQKQNSDNVILSFKKLRIKENMKDKSNFVFVPEKKKVHLFLQDHHPSFLFALFLSSIFDGNFIGGFFWTLFPLYFLFLFFNSNEK